MKFAFRGVSGAALLLGLSGGFQAAWAQQTTTPATPANPNQTVTTAQATQAARPVAGPEQTAPPAEEAATSNRVVVTGSLIATKPEDAPKPVEVYTREQLQESGSPSINEFLRNMTVNSDTSGFGGEANSTGGATTGFTAANLRGLGASGTLTLLNGKRLASTNGGSGADSNTLPSGALEAVEILKGGASTTYGAGAVGGVINYITRRDVAAPEITLEQRYYADSDPANHLNFLTGWVGDTGNILFNYEYQDEGRLGAEARSFGTLPWNVNPDGFSTLLAGYSPGRYVRQAGFFNTLAAGTNVNAAAIGAPQPTPVSTSNGDGLIQDYRTPADCRALGGELANIIAPRGNSRDDTCVLPDYMIGADLVSEFKSHKVYVEANADITDNMEFHIEGLYSKAETIRRDTPASPSQNRAVLTPTGAGATAAAVGGVAGPTICSTTTNQSCIFMLLGNVPTYSTAGVRLTGAGTSVRNPFINDFATRTGRTIAADDAIFTGNNWRPFGASGNPQYDDGYSQNKVERERFQVNASLKGDLALDNWLGGIAGFLSGSKYEVSSQFNFYDQTQTYYDLIMSRYQNALNGYGGPACQAKDRVATVFEPLPRSAFGSTVVTATNTATIIAAQTAQYNAANLAAYNATVGIQSDTAAGTKGCQFLNPFVTNFSNSIYNGASNPQYNAALPTASPELLAWLMHKRVDELQNIAVTFDATLSGEVGGFQLPGGAIGWAGGVQVRSVESRSGPQDATTFDRAAEFNYCPWPGDQDLIGRALTATNEPFQAPGQLGCSLTAPPGTHYAVGRPAPSYSDEQALGLYAELQLPVFDSLNFSLSVRRESYNGGDLVGNIYSVAGKWDITDNFYVRSDYGTNFRNQGLSAIPGQETYSVSGALCCTARFSSSPLLINRTDTTIGPENDTSFNFGGGFRTDDLFGGRFDAGFTFFETLIDGDLVGGGTDTRPYTLMLNNIFGSTTPNTTGHPLGYNAGQNPVDYVGQGCDSPFLKGADPLIALNGGLASCGAATLGSDIISIIKLQQNGGGLITNGIDYTLNYSLPLDVISPALVGNFAVQATATQTLVYKVKGYDLYGQPFLLDGNRLGYRNQNTGSGGSNSREWRFNVLTRWTNDVHTVSLNTNFQSGTKDGGYYACLAPYYNETTRTQVSNLEQFFTCGNSLTAVNYVTPSPATAQTLAGAAAYSTYGVFPEDFVTFDLSYIYRPTWLEGMELRATVVNLTNELPIADQTARGYGTGDPRMRTFEIEFTKKF